MSYVDNDHQIKALRDFAKLLMEDIRKKEIALRDVYTAIYQRKRDLYEQEKALKVEDKEVLCQATGRPYHGDIDGDGWL